MSAAPQLSADARVRVNLLPAANELRALRRMHARMVREFEAAIPLTSAPVTVETVREAEREMARMTAESFARIMPGLSPEFALGFLVLPRAALRFLAKRMEGCASGSARPAGVTP